MPSSTTREIANTHPDKPYWPEDGLTKADMMAYYQAMAPVLLPWFRDRPVTLRLFPKGIHGPSFYRREQPSSAPEWLRSVRYSTRSDHHQIELPLIDSREALLYLANLGSIEFHLWASRAPRLERPDWAVFDLDPGPGIGFAQVLKAALLLRERLQEQGIDSYPKTSGATGLHVLSPATEYRDFDRLRAWVRELAQELADRHPKLFAPPRQRSHAGKGVTIDYRQNSIGHNTAAPYSLRALPGAPVSAPLSWDEVEKGRVRPGDFTLRSLPDRVHRLGDLHAPLLRQIRQV